MAAREVFGPTANKSLFDNWERVHLSTPAFLARQESPPAAILRCAAARKLECVVDRLRPDDRHRGALDFLPAVKSLAGRLTRFLKTEVAVINSRRKGQRRGGRPDLIKRRAVLAAVQTASRRLRRWPLASLDRRSARRGEIMQAGAEKRHSNRTEKLPISWASIGASGKSMQVGTIKKRTDRPSRTKE